MMNLINTVQNEYNENVLTDNYKNVNNTLWTATNLTGATMVESEDYTYEEGKSLHLNILGLDVDQTEFAPTVTDNFNFEVFKTGTYIFSFRVLSPATAPFFPEFEGRFFLNRVGGLPLTIPLEFKIGNNTVPEFTFEYRRWQTFYAEITLSAGETYTLSGEIDAAPTWIAGPVDLYFAGFKLEYSQDKAYNIPTYYTKPAPSNATNTTYREISAMTFLKSYDKTVIITANTFTVVLPPALPCKGNIIEIANKGAGTTTVMGFGIDTIDSAPSLAVLTETSIRIISNGTAWKVLSVSPN